jgi:hypothetical protein
MLLFLLLFLFIDFKLFHKVFIHGGLLLLLGFELRVASCELRVARDEGARDSLTRPLEGDDHQLALGATKSRRFAIH